MPALPQGCLQNISIGASPTRTPRRRTQHEVPDTLLYRGRRHLPCLRSMLPGPYSCHRTCTTAHFGMQPGNTTMFAFGCRQIGSTRSGRRRYSQNYKKVRAPNSIGTHSRSCKGAQSVKLCLMIPQSTREFADKFDFVSPSSHFH